MKNSICLYLGGEWVADPREISDQGGNLNFLPGKAPHIVRTIRELNSELPHFKTVNLYVPWFANAKHINDDFTIQPRVEVEVPRHMNHDIHDWHVAGYERVETMKTSRFGGTANDESLIELCKYLRDEGFEIEFTPLLLVDDVDKTWRGEIKCQSIEQLIKFFNEYNEYILHYANLLKDYISLFYIGSELKGVTTKQIDGRFPAIDKMIELAANCKLILNDTAKISYAANWGDEYHHIEGGLRPLDKLWSAGAIDAVAISAYFPADTESIEVELIKAALKHYEYGPDWSVSALKPWIEAGHNAGKDVIIAEYGCPVRAYGHKEPNNFWDKTSHSVDVALNYLKAAWQFFAESGVSEACLYAIDARPIDILTSSDRSDHEQGHFINHNGVLGALSGEEGAVTNLT